MAARTARMRATLPTELAVSQLNRLLLAVIIVLVDAAIFFVPLAALFIAYVLVANPPWVRDFLNGLASPPSGGDSSV